MSLNSRKSSLSGIKLIIAIDVGTTFTAASFCLLDENGHPHKLQEVNRWPKQVTGDAKVPSVIYYDNEKRPRLHGAETEDEDSLYEAETFGWSRAEWWKLLLRPDHLLLPAGFSPFPLPPGLSIDEIFHHHFLFVRMNVRNFIMKHHGIDERMMNGLESASHVILTAPNGWEGKHQHRMRLAALKAGLVGQGHSIRFISEGEAAVHYALDDISLKFQTNSVILVCDAGGGTTDIGIYKIKSMDPMIVHEACSPSCHVAGGTFVNERAKLFINEQVQGTKWGQPGYIVNAMREFEKNAKRKFKGSEKCTFLRLDISTQSVAEKGIENGRLAIPCETMVSFFDPFIEIIIHGLEDTLSRARLQVDHIVIVGGFAESDYVFSKLTQWATKQQISIGKPDGVASKAIAHGALSWHLRSAVRVRIAKYHYGAETDLLYDRDDFEMKGRGRFQNILGETRVRGAWHSVVQKDQRLGQSTEFYRPFHGNFGENDSLVVELEIFAYRWDAPPRFFKDKDGGLVEGFIHLGTLKADLTRCYNAAKSRVSPTGKRYKSLEYDICLSVDLAEIRARLRWKETRHGYKYGDAVVAYDV